MPSSDMQLRKLLFMSHPCLGRYGDDGEMQCGACRIDFRRDDPELIERRLIEAAFFRYETDAS